MSEETEDNFQHNKAFLIQYRRITHKLEILEDRLAGIDAQIQSLPSVEISDMPGGGTPRTLDDFLERKEELESRINELVQSRRECRVQIDHVIDKLDGDEMDVLECRLIDLMEFDEIAKRIHRDVRTVQRIYAAGIRNIDVPCS